MIVAVVENGVLYSVRTDHIGRPAFVTDGGGTEIGCPESLSLSLLGSIFED